MISFPFLINFPHLTDVSQHGNNLKRRLPIRGGSASVAPPGKGGAEMSNLDKWNGARCVAGIPIEELSKEPADVRYAGLDSHEIKELAAYEESMRPKPAERGGMSYGPKREINIPVG
jgi:hypothetical protein